MASILFGDTQWDHWITSEEEKSLTHVILEEELTLARYYKQILEMNPGLIRTPTRNINRPRLQTMGQADRLEAIINIAVSAGIYSREQMKKDCLLAGVLGPWNEDGMMEPFELEKIFGEPAIFLIDKGIDCLIMEGFSNYSQFRVAIQTVRKVNTVPIPIAAFYRLPNSFDKKEVSKVLELGDIMELDLTGFEVEVNDIQRLIPMLPNDDTSVGLQIINAKGLLLTPTRLKDLSQSILTAKPVMLLGGDGISSQDWQKLCSKLKE